MFAFAFVQNGNLIGFVHDPTNRPLFHRFAALLTSHLFPVFPSIDLRDV
jgi:hypothetical protein